jgi:FkbM family methyltransferase
MIQYFNRKVLRLRNKFFSYRKEKQLEEKRLAFYRQFISHNDMVFDVGANMGNRIKIFLRLNTKIIAFEPQTKCSTYLKRKFRGKIILIPKGVGEKAERKKFYIADSSVLSSFSEEWIISTQKSGRFEEYKWDKTEYVELTTLDLTIQNYGVPQFIKIDVEGYELEVLKGLSYPINYISFEYAVPEQTKKTIECIKQIENVNGQYNTLYNYSIAEEMEFALDKWLTVDEMINHIHSQKFQNTSFGDIYARRSY